eukprot:5054564-Pyramimonas_sp.AAC.1
MKPITQHALVLSPGTAEQSLSARYGYILSPLLRLVPAAGIFSLPSCDWCPLRVYSLSPSATGARY